MKKFSKCTTNARIAASSEVEQFKYSLSCGKLIDCKCKRILSNGYNQIKMMIYAKNNFVAQLLSPYFVKILEILIPKPFGWGTSWMFISPESKWTAFFPNQIQKHFVGQTFIGSSLDIEWVVENLYISLIKKTSINVHYLNLMFIQFFPMILLSI